jgi:hypothetical protein
MRFEQRVGLAAALAIAEVDVLVVHRADFGIHVAAGPAVVLGAWSGYFLLDYLALCVLSAVAAWMRGWRPAGARPARKARGSGGAREIDEQDGVTPRHVLYRPHQARTRRQARAAT